MEIGKNREKSKISYKRNTIGDFYKVTTYDEYREVHDVNHPIHESGKIYLKVLLVEISTRLVSLNA